MRRLAPLAGLALVLALGCYTDDVGGPGGGKPANPVVRVLVSDAPFPFDSVQSVNVYIDSIEATTSADTADSSVARGWVTLTAPHKAVNLLDYQQGALALVGQGTLKAGQYSAIRITIDIDSSSIIKAGVPASVHWNNNQGNSLVTIYALVQPAISVQDSVSDLVLDFDVGRSFPYNLFGDGAFNFIPWIRAVNSAETGAIAGTVTTAYTGTPQPVQNADITVYAGNQPFPFPAPVLATGRTDASGHYRVAFLTAGTYIISVTQPSDPYLATVTIGGLSVAAGGTQVQNVSLPAAGAGNAGVHVTGPTTVGVGGTITLLAAVTDSQGNQVPNPTIAWTSSDSAVASSISPLHVSVDSILGNSPGFATIRATYGTLSDSLVVQVVPAGPDNVTSVVITPSSQYALVGDSVTLYAQPYDTVGNALSGRPVSWLISDSTIARLFAYGQSALLQPLKVGTVTLQASSEGRMGTATVTVDSVASIQVVPGGTTMAVGDSNTFVVQFFGTHGETLRNLPVTWTLSDTTVARFIYVSPYQAVVRGFSVGTDSIQATTQRGKVSVGLIHIN